MDQTAVDRTALGDTFWPAFADLMLALSLALLVVLFVVSVVLHQGTLDLRPVEQNQLKLINAIAGYYDDHIIEEVQDTICIAAGANDTCSMRIITEPLLQHITFSDRVLFPLNRWELSQQGRFVLSAIGGTLAKNQTYIREIQIHGHADNTQPIGTGGLSNLTLAGYRAMEVFTFLNDSVGLDPLETLMSATSFGEFCPVNRSFSETAYDRVRLEKDNATKELRDRNRRIGLLLFYRR